MLVLDKEPPVFMSLVLSLALHAAPKVDPKLVGTWTLANEPFMTLNANGTGLMDEGKVKWTADGSSLVVTDDEGTADKAGYKVDGDTLVMTMGGIPLTLTRAGAGVQVKNRTDLAFDSARSAGYRDVAVNLRIVNRLTLMLGLETHVCEVQLILRHFADLKVCRRCSAVGFN